MTGYFVRAGNVHKVKCPSALSRETATQSSVVRTLGGKRKAFTRPGGRRDWSLNVGLATPKEAGVVEALARYGDEVGWYGPEAAAGNVLSPQATAFDVVPANASDAGLVTLPDGTLARAVAHAGAGVVYAGTAHGNYEMVPVMPGLSLTVGVWALNGVRITGSWRDATGGHIRTPDGGIQSFSGWQRRSVTFAPPSNAAYYVLALSEGAQYARPSVSWGNTAADEEGTGCPRAVIHSPSHSVLTVTRWSNLTSSSYSVTEVG